MSAFEDFWLAIGDRVRIGDSRPPAERPIELRRVLAARAFEHWRTGRLQVTPPDNGRGDAWIAAMSSRARAYARGEALSPLPNPKSSPIC